MYRFWETITSRVFDCLDPQDIVEIGSEHAHNTRKLLAYCKEHRGRVHVIEPLPKFDVDELKQQYGDQFVLYQGLSLNALSQVPRMDLVLIDGDHNWYTVYNELTLIERLCDERDEPFPFVLLHDMAWPYARRDLYYDPETIPEAFRQAYKKGGMVPGVAELQEGKGLNRNMNNAVYENTPHNGVRTAVEDFVAQTDKQISLQVIPVFMGLGILCLDEVRKKNPMLDNFLNDLAAETPQRELLARVEEERLSTLIAHENKRFDIMWLQDKREQCEKGLAATRQQCDKLREDIKQARERAEQAEALKSEYLVLKEQCRALEDENAGYGERVNKLEAENTGYRERVNKLEDAQNELAIRLGRAEAQLEIAAERAQDLAQQLDEQRALAEELRAQEGRQDQQLTRTLAELAEHKSYIESLRHKNQESAALLDEKRCELATQALVEKNRAIVRLLQEREEHAQHIRWCINHIEGVQVSVTRLLRSWRWQIGHRLCRVVEVSTFQPSRSKSPQLIAAAIEKYKGWKEEYVARESGQVSRTVQENRNEYRSKEEFEALLAYKQSVIAAIQNEIEDRSNDLKRLTGYAEELHGLVRNIMRSYRYRIGNLAINVIDRFCIRPHPSIQLYEIDCMIEQYRSWMRCCKPLVTWYRTPVCGPADGSSVSGVPGMGLDAVVLAEVPSASLAAHASSVVSRADLDSIRITQFTPSNPRNPYYSMIPLHLRTLGWNYEFNPDRDQLLQNVRSSEFKHEIIHFHQLEPSYHSRKGSLDETRQNAEQFLDFLRDLKQAGARLVWTKHNPLPHDRQYEEVDRAFIQQACDLMERVVVLGKKASAYMAQFAAPDRVVVIPHPSLGRHYGPLAPREQARTHLGLPLDPQQFVFGNLGEIKPYKGLELILEAFEQVTSQVDGPPPALILAGRPGAGDYVESLRQKAPDSVILRPELIPDADIPLWLGTMDAGVFAFRDIWGSTSVILSLSYQTPVLVPRVGCLEDYVHEEDTGFTYKHDSVDDLVEKMLLFQQTPLLPHMQYMCDKFNRDFSIDKIGEQFARLYGEVAGL